MDVVLKIVAISIFFLIGQSQCDVRNDRNVTCNTSIRCSEEQVRLLEMMQICTSSLTSYSGIHKNIIVYPTAKKCSTVTN